MKGITILSAFAVSLALANPLPNAEAIDHDGLSKRCQTRRQAEVNAVKDGCNQAEVYCHIGKEHCCQWGCYSGFKDTLFGTSFTAGQCGTRREGFVSHSLQLLGSANDFLSSC